jgi:general secretion pathway protein E
VLNRLIDMGVEPFLVSSSLVAVLAQRLVRRLCTECKEPFRPTASELTQIGALPSDVDGYTIYRPVGCSECLSTGYRGRAGIFELLMVDDDVRALVTARKSAGVVRKVALAHGMASLRHDGLRKMLEGVTSLDEVLRVTQEDLEVEA